MSSLDIFLQKIEKNILEGGKIGMCDVQTFANILAYNCLKDYTVVAKINLFLIDNKIDLKIYGVTYFEDCFFECLYYADLAKGRCTNCRYQEAPPTKQQINEIKDKYSNILECVPFEKF